MESVALLTKPMGIVTPQILSIVVVVAPRLISYKIIETRSYHTVPSNQIVSYRASVVRSGKKENGQSNVSAK